MDSRVGSGQVGSGHDFGGFLGQVSISIFLVFFTDYYLVPESIKIFENYIRLIVFLRNLI